MRLPTGVAVIDGDLHVADAWHHRVLVYDGIPAGTDTPPAFVVGQDGGHAVEPNRGGECDASSLYWPFGIGSVGGYTWVADTGNKRVLGWRGRLEPGRPADVVLGQDDPSGRADNRGGPPDGRGMRWPHAVAGARARQHPGARQPGHQDPGEDVLLVADAGNHRVLAWQLPVQDGAPARLALGQPDLTSTGEWPYGPQGAARLRFPYAVTAGSDGRVLVADTANNRVLGWPGLPGASGAPATLVLGQGDFDSAGENRWEAVRDDTLCWPYGLASGNGGDGGSLLAVADSGNNRVMLWDLP
jgi:hypothetical protein